MVLLKPSLVSSGGSTLETLTHKFFFRLRKALYIQKPFHCLSAKGGDLVDSPLLNWRWGFKFQKNN